MDETTEYRYLAAVGVCYLLIIALNKSLRETGYYTNSQKEPNLLSFLDIVALGTVCDVMPIKGLNRVFVRQGLRVMAKGQNLGLRTLSDVAAIDSYPSSYHLGFVLGPRINAGGRVGQANLGSRLLTTEQQAEAFEIANLLSMYNDQRKEIEQSVLEEAIAAIEQLDTLPACIISLGEGWHQGVIGIIASRLKERYDRPSIVLSVEGGIAKASARSVKGIDMGAAVSEAKKQGLLIAGGGHEMAAGFSIETDKIELLSQFLDVRFSDALEDYQSKKSLKIDAVISISGLSVNLIKELEKASPFGVGNPSPKFALYNCMILRADIVGEKHIRCIIGSHMTGKSGKSLKAMCFRAVDTEIGTALLHNKGKPVHIAGQVRINSWQGTESAEFT
ncbi:MAG: DHH family phosphoesterase, partial [Rickettsiales bacterium]|nr:DHH family phosphoesterase [Rickettsiales bacterium]